MKNRLYLQFIAGISQATDNIITQLKPCLTISVTFWYNYNESISQALHVCLDINSGSCSDCLGAGRSDCAPRSSISLQPGELGMAEGIEMSKISLLRGQQAKGNRNQTAKCQTLDMSSVWADNRPRFNSGSCPEQRASVQTKRSKLRKCDNCRLIPECGARGNVQTDVAGSSGNLQVNKTRSAAYRSSSGWRGRKCSG